jgi:hypothetical protein
MTDYSIDRWVARMPRHQWLRDEAQWHQVGERIPPLIAGDRALAEVHRLDLSLFVIFEETALRVSGALTRNAPDAEALSFCAQQTLDEARHLDMFRTRLEQSAAAQGRSAEPASAILSPPLTRFIARCHEVADSGAFVEGLTLMNLIFEGMAYPLYAYEERYWQALDPYLAALVRSAFVDESRHVGLGAALVRRALAGDPARREAVRALCREATTAMEQVFDYYIRTFVSMFDAVARRHGDLFGDAEFAPGRPIATTPYAEQVRTIQESMKREHSRLLANAELL